MIDRLQCFLKGQSPQGNLLVITHGGVIRAFYALLNNLSPKKAFDLQVDYGQVIELQIET
jgi:broad specificity phosphatase PhoE